MASNLTQVTRDLVDRAWRSAIGYGSPLFTRMLERKQVVEGGTTFTQLYESSDDQSLVQEYGPNDGLTGGSKEFIKKPTWGRAYLACPMEIDVDTEVMNKPKGDAQLLDIASKKATRALKALKLQMMHRQYGCATDNEIDTQHTYMQGLISALLEDTTYGTLARTTTAHPEWQSADEDNWDTATPLNKTNIDGWLDSCMEFAEERGEFLIVMGDTLWNRLKAIFEASHTYQPKASKAVQGFESMEYSGVEIAKDYLLDRMVYTGSTNNQGSVAIGHNGSKTYGEYTSEYAGLTGDSTYAGTQYVFVLDLRTWHLQYSFRNSEQSSRAGDSMFVVTDYFDQSQVKGGKEEMLAHTKFRGNLICSMPNRNLMRGNVS